MSFHGASDNELERKRFVLVISDLQDQLVEKADFTMIFGMTVHGQSPSDTVDGQPGGDDE